MLNKYHVLRKYKDVFPKELLGLPPKWEFDFLIDLVSRVEPISITPYRMNTIEMQELKV